MFSYSIFIVFSRTSVVVFENWVFIVISDFPVVASASVPSITESPSGFVASAAETAALPPSKGSLSDKGELPPVSISARVLPSELQSTESAASNIVESESSSHFALSDAMYLTMLAWIDFDEFYLAAAV